MYFVVKQMYDLFREKYDYQITKYKIPQLNFNKFLTTKVKYNKDQKNK